MIKKCPAATVDVQETEIVPMRPILFCLCRINPTANDFAFPSYPSGSPGAFSARTAMCTNLMTGHNAELVGLKARNGQLEERSRNLEGRIRQLEDQLSSKQTPEPIQGLNFNTETMGPLLSGPFLFPRDSDSPSQCRGIISSFIRKNRFLGPSHCAVTGISLISDIFETISAHLRENPSNPWSGLERCNSLSSVIKAQRISSTSSLPTPDLPPQRACRQTSGSLPLHK